MSETKTTNRNLFHDDGKVFGLSLMVNIGLMLFFLLFFYCNFETNDDYTMKMIVSGAYGSPDSHIVFINSIIAYLLKGLYLLIPSWPWYEMFQYLCILASLTAITFVFIRKRSDVAYLLLAYTALFITARFLYVDLQFTKTAAICTSAGYILLDHALHRNKTAGVIIATLFLFLGILYRSRQFLLISLISVPLFVPILLQMVKDLVKERQRILKLVICALVCAAFYFVSFPILRSDYADPDWKYYRTFNSTRAALLDRNEVDYENDEAFYKSLGLEADDVRMLDELWNFDDPDFFTLEKLQTLLNKQKQIKKGYDISFSAFFKAVTNYFIKTRNKLIFLIVMVVAMAVLMVDKGGIPSFIGALLSVASAAFGIFYTYFFRNSAFLDRVHLSALMAALLVIVHLIAPSQRKKKLVPTIAGILAISLFFSYLWVPDLRIYSAKKVRDDLKIAALNQIKEDSDHIYVRTTDESLDYVSGIFLDDDVYCARNVLSLGGWMTGMPIRDEVKKEYGVMNPFRDIVNNDKAYLIVSAPDRLELISDYIRRHYAPDLKLELVKTIEANKTYSVYKLTDGR